MQRLFLFIGVIFSLLFIFSIPTYAATCSGSGQRTKYVRTCDQSPNDPNSYTCHQGATTETSYCRWIGNECLRDGDITTGEQCVVGNACTPGNIGGFSSYTASGCSVSDTPGPTSPPIPGACNSGSTCFTGLSNCGEVGFDEGDGSCSPGRCCKPKGGPLNINVCRTENPGPGNACKVEGEFCGNPCNGQGNNPRCCNGLVVNWQGICGCPPGYNCNVSTAPTQFVMDVGNTGTFTVQMTNMSQKDGNDPNGTYQPSCEDPFNWVFEATYGGYTNGGLPPVFDFPPPNNSPFWNGDFGDPGSFSCNPAPASESYGPFTIQALKTGASYVQVDIVTNQELSKVNPAYTHSSACTVNIPVIVRGPGAWWQVKDGDVVTNGNLSSNIPATCTGACNPAFILNGAGGYPGVAMYGGNSYDFSSSSTSVGTVSSPRNWVANSQFRARTFDYDYFESLIPIGVTFNAVSGSVNGGTFASGGAASRGYVWYKATGDLTINSTVNVNGSRKVILLVDGGNLTISGRINIGTPGSGFFMAIVGKDASGGKGDIIVDSSLSHPTQPVLEGLFVADDQFLTGAGTSRLYMRGSVVAYGGVVMQRDLGDAGNPTAPSEIFEYAPELLLAYPPDLGKERITWKEVAP